MDEQIDIRFATNAPQYAAESKKIEEAITGVEKRHTEATEDMTENIRIQKSVLKDLDTQYKALEKATKSMAPGAAQAAAIDQLRAAKQEIEDERLALKALENQNESYKKSCQSLRTQIMETRNHMATLTEGTEEYEAAMRRLGELQDHMGDIQAQGRVFADDEKYFRTSTELVQGLSGAMSVGVGVASLFGASQENLAKIQARLQAVMAISIGVQQVAQVLNKDSYVSHILLAGAKKLVTVATMQLSVALGVSTGAAKMLMATLTLGLSVAITAVVWAIDKMITSSNEAKQKQEELAQQAAKTQQQFNESVAASVSKQVISLKKLQDEWAKLSNLDEQKKFIKDNKAAFDELGISIGSVKDAENLLVNNTGAFIASIKAKAMALAYSDLAAAEYQKVIQKQLEKEQRKKTITEEDRQAGEANYERQYYATKNNPIARSQISGKENDYKAAGIKTSQNAAAAVIQKDVDESLTKVDAYFEASQTLFDTAIKQLKDNGFKQSKGSAAATTTNDNTGRLAAQARERQWAIEQARIDAINDGDSKRLAQLDLNHAKEVAKLADQQKAALVMAANDSAARVKIKDDFAILIAAADNKYMGERLAVGNDMQTALGEQMQKEADLLAAAYDAEAAAKNEYLTRYGTAEEKRYAITANYAQKIIEAKTESQKKLLEKERDQALSNAEMEEVQKSGFPQLFGNLDNLALPTMKSLRDKIKTWIDSAGQSLTPEDFKAVSDAFQKLDLKIADKDPFGEMKTAGQEYKKATKEVAAAQANLNDLQAKGITSGKQYQTAQETLTTAQDKQAAAIAKQQQAITSTADKGKQILGATQDVLNILNDLGIKVPEEIAGALDGIGQMLDGLGSMDLTKPFSIVTGSVKMLGGLVKSIGSLFGGSKKTMAELEERQKADKEKAYLAELEINSLYRERYEWAQKIGESTLENMKRQGEELKKQTSANAKDQDDLWAKLMGADYKSGEHFEKTGLFGWGKGKIEEDWSSLSGKSWKEIQELAASGALSEEGQKYYEALKKAKDEGEDLAKSQQEYIEKMRELTTGSSYESVVDKAMESLKDGTKTAAETFDDIMSGAVDSALKMLTDKKMRKWYEDFAQKGEGGYTEDEIAQAKKEYLEYVKQLNEDAKALEKVTGVSIGNKTDNAQSLTGQIRGSVATEASVAELGGIFRGQYDKLASIDSTLTTGFASLVEMARNNALIEANTRRTADNTAATVQTLVAGFGAMQTELVSIKNNTTKDTGSYGN